MKNINLTTALWPGYEILDSGGNRKLERYGSFALVRPETQAIWKPAHPELWKQAVAEFEWAEGKGKWRQKKGAPESWQLFWNDVRFTVRLTSFKHTGVFPEQAENWKWIERAIAASRQSQPKVLNLFGYTGIASIVAARAHLKNSSRRSSGSFSATKAGFPSRDTARYPLAEDLASRSKNLPEGRGPIFETGSRGAQVTHVDASKQSNEWAKENARLSGIPDGNIRFLLDDALKFAEREVRRGAVYEGIILDPPAFGRGPKGEVWRIEEQLPRLLDALAKLLAEKPGSFFLLNGYAAGYSPQSFSQAVESAFGTLALQGEFGELGLDEARTKRIVPQGIYARFIR